MSNLIHRRGLAIGPMASVGFSWGDHHVYAASLAGPDGHQLTKKRLKNARCSLGNRTIRRDSGRAHFSLLVDS